MTFGTSDTYSQVIAEHMARSVRRHDNFFCLNPTSASRGRNLRNFCHLNLVSALFRKKLQERNEMCDVLIGIYFSKTHQPGLKYANRLRLSLNQTCPIRIKNAFPNLRVSRLVYRYWRFTQQLIICNLIQQKIHHEEKVSGECMSL